MEKFGGRHLHHVAVLVDDIDKASAAMKESGIAFTGEVVGRSGGALRQIFTQAEMHDNEPFTVLELTERHFGFKGFSPPQAQGLMQLDDAAQEGGVENLCVARAVQRVSLGSAPRTGLATPRQCGPTRSGV